MTEQENTTQVNIEELAQKLMDMTQEERMAYLEDENNELSQEDATKLLEALTKLAEQRGVAAEVKTEELPETEIV